MSSSGENHRVPASAAAAADTDDEPQEPPAKKMLFSPPDTPDAAAAAAAATPATGQPRDQLPAAVEELAKLMSLHSCDQSVLQNLATAVQRIDFQNGLAEGDRQVMSRAADAVVAQLTSVDSEATRVSAAHVGEAIRAGTAVCPGDILTPLKTQLGNVQDMLQVYAHTTLSFCSMPIEGEASVLDVLSTIMIAPAVVQIKATVKEMCEHIEKNVQVFREHVSGKGKEDKKIYELVFQKFAGESAPKEQRVAYKHVLAQISDMKTELKGRGKPGTVQPHSGVLQLTMQFRALSGEFSNLVTKIAAGIDGVTVKQRSALKSLYRMLEKGLLKGSSTADWRAALSSQASVNCSKVLDGVACIFLCVDFKVMDDLVQQMRRIVASSDTIDFCRVKNRWEQPTDGGWRDLMINLVVNSIVVEIQVVHSKLYVARDGLEGHSTYGDIRCFQELLAFTGNEDAIPAQKKRRAGESYDIVFSHKSDQLPFIRQLIEGMKASRPDLRCFCQDDLDATHAGQWTFQWLEAYDKAKLCVCVLTKDYLESKPCCTEWKVATSNSTRFGKPNIPQIVLTVHTPEEIVESITHTPDNSGIMLHLRSGDQVLQTVSKTLPELCASIATKLPHSQQTSDGSRDGSVAALAAAAAAAAVDGGASAVGGGAARMAVAEVPASSVDILVIVDYPTHGGGGGTIEPAKYIAPFQALETAMGAKFVGTQARIRFHTPRSIVAEDPDLLKERIPCLCWIAMGEEAPAVEGSSFTTSFWKANGGACDFAIVLMKHGAEFISEKLLDDGCADRVLWVSADYTDTQKTNEFLADGKSYTAAIPRVIYAVLTGAAFRTERAAQECYNLALDLAHKRSIDAGIKKNKSTREILQITEGDERPVDNVGKSFARTPSDPAQLKSTMVGISQHNASVDLNQWPQLCDLLQTLNKGRNTLGVVAVTGGTDVERKVVAWTAVQSYIAVADRFKLVVYRDADLPASSRQSPETFDLPFDTHGDQDVLVWMDCSQTDFPLEALHEAIDSSIEDKSVPFPWTFILTGQSDFDDVVDEFADAKEIQLEEAVGTTVNESSADLIRIVPAHPTLKIKNILEVVTAAELLNLLAAALPQTADETSSSRGVKDYIDQILVGENDSVVVRGMAANTKFLFELRNDLVDGRLDQRINNLLRDFVGDARDLGGQEWTLDKSAFVSIYPTILSQMDQLSPHQRERLNECKVAKRVHVTGPAGCGKTFIALHMVIDLIEAAELVSGTLSKESPILFVGKNEALCRFFVNWIFHRLRKKKKTKAAKALLSAYIKVLHTSPFEGHVFSLQFGSGGGKIGFAKEHVSSNHALVIVDEAHHIFASGRNADDAANITALCTHASQSLLLSDISQSGEAADVAFPTGHTDVVLKEVVRNSSRIVTASLPFCRSVDLADVTCNHGVRGPPLEPFMFANCGADESSRYTKYVEGILHGLKHMMDKFPGAEMHDNLVILVPNEDFKVKLLKSGVDKEVLALNVTFVDAVKGAFPESKRKETEPSRVILDTLASFDGMERLFVFAVGLDSVKTTEGCCGIYRAITRAHMFVCVVQEHLKGGWLEFTAAIQGDRAFDEAKERKRVDRNNLVVIASEEARAEAKKDAGDDSGSTHFADDTGTTTTAAGGGVGAATAADADADYNDDNDDDDDDDDATDTDAGGTDGTFSQNGKPKKLVITTSVWGTNLNSNATLTISKLFFDPFSDHGQPDGRIDSVEPNQLEIKTEGNVVITGSNLLSGGNNLINVELAGVAVQGIVSVSDSEVVVKLRSDTVRAGDVLLMADNGKFVNGAGFAFVPAVELAPEAKEFRRPKGGRAKPGALKGKDVRLDMPGTIYHDRVGKATAYDAASKKYTVEYTSNAKSTESEEFAEKYVKGLSHLVKQYLLESFDHDPVTQEKVRKKLQSIAPAIQIHWDRTLELKDNLVPNKEGNLVVNHTLVNKAIDTKIKEVFDDFKTFHQSIGGNEGDVWVKECEERIDTFFANAIIRLYGWKKELGDQLTLEELNQKAAAIDSKIGNGKYPGRQSINLAPALTKAYNIMREDLINRKKPKQHIERRAAILKFLADSKPTPKSLIDILTHVRKMVNFSDTKPDQVKKDLEELEKGKEPKIVSVDVAGTGDKSWILQESKAEYDASSAKKGEKPKTAASTAAAAAEDAMQSQHVDNGAATSPVTAGRPPSPKARIKRIEDDDAEFAKDDDDVADASAGTNIAGMDLDDFQQLVRIVFEKHTLKQLGLDGKDASKLQVRVAPHKHFREIDLVLQDLRPIIGQKIVVRARCYRHTVGPEPVRALVYSVAEHSANKGIFVTTSTFGPEAERERDSSQGKIELLNGDELLGIMQNIGMDTHFIDIAAVRAAGLHTLEKRRERGVTKGRKRKDLSGGKDNGGPADDEGAAPGGRAKGNTDAVKDDDAKSGAATPPVSL